MFKHKRVFTKLLWLLAIIMLAACQQVLPNNQLAAKNEIHETIEMSDKERDIVNKLNWVTTADAQKDAHKALNVTGTEKVEIIGFSGRGKSFPGLSSSQYQEIKDLVTYRLAEGTGDVIHGSTQLALRKELRQYVSQYNTIIYQAIKKSL